MRALALTFALIFGPSVPVHAIDMNSISCIEAATSGPRGEYTHRQIGLILQSLGNYWRLEFAMRGLAFREIRYHVFRGSVESACGTFDTKMGPYYCFTDSTIYLDPDFFEMARAKIGRPTQTFLTFILAHEVGHHIQNLLKVLQRVTQFNAQLGIDVYKSPDLLPRLEFQADCLAGVFLSTLYNHDLMTREEVQESVSRMLLLGDDAEIYRWLIHLPVQTTTASGGYPHGSSQERQEWFNRGLKGGRMESCESLGIPTLF